MEKWSHGESRTHSEKIRLGFTENVAALCVFRCHHVFFCTKRPLFHCLSLDAECGECFGIWRDSRRGSVRKCWKTLAEQELKRWTCQGWKCWFAHVASWPAIVEGEGERAVQVLLHEQMLGRSSLRQSFWLTDPALLPLQIRISYVTRIYLSLKQGSCTALP